MINGYRDMSDFGSQAIKNFKSLEDAKAALDEMNLDPAQKLGLHLGRIDTAYIQEVDFEDEDLIYADLGDIYAQRIG